MQTPQTELLQISESFLIIEPNKEQNQKAITNFDYNPAKTESLFFCLEDGICYKYDLNNQEINLTINTNNDPILGTLSLKYPDNQLSCIRFEENLNQLITCSLNGIIQSWDSNTGDLINTFNENQLYYFSQINCIDFEGNNKWMVLGHDDYITKWHIKTGLLQWICEIESETNIITIGKNQEDIDQCILTGHGNSLFQQWSLDGKLMYTKNDSNLNAITSILAGGSDNSQIYILAGYNGFVDVYYNNARLFSYYPL
eukprot:TRINITY_DN5919_c0_g1_i3.p2 TRINITY_DN5919_c0_g1~~TRINITY_DN5919_c0_g1_i3.p2  ORF type:complete len:256 (-),score=37.41 TRINITY_DN5919_c0_g1_i3:121-888(-)